MTAVVSYANLIDATTAVLTLPAGTAADPDHPISNLKLRGLGDYLQLTDNDNMVVDIDFGSAKTFNFIATLGLGMLTPQGGGATNLTYYVSADGISWTAVAVYAFVDLAPQYLPGVAYAVIPGGVTTRYLRVFPEWNCALPRRFARLWVSNALIVGDVVQDSTDFGFTDPGELSETDGQQYVEFRKLRTKRLQLSFRGLTTLEMWGFEDGALVAFDVPSINGMQFAAGTTGEVIVLPIASDETVGSPLIWQNRTGIYGHAASPYAITRDINSNSWTANLTVQEER